MNNDNYTKERLLFILEYVDRSIYESMRDKKCAASELEKLIIVGIVSMRQDLQRSRKYEKEYRKKIAWLSQLDAFKNKT
jgi:hypothetical protein